MQHTYTTLSFQNIKLGFQPKYQCNWLNRPFLFNNKMMINKQRLMQVATASLFGAV